MRVRIFITIAMLLIATFVLAQQSGQQSTMPPQQPTATPQQSGQQPIGQPTSTPQTSTQQPMTMSTSGQEPMVKTAQEAKFATVPGLPDCLTASLDRGDPTSGPWVLYVKMASGCSVPWHWHTSYEQAMFVTGTGQLQTKGQQAQTVSQGAYAYLPGQHQHQLACPNGCTFYLSSDASFDLHYVDVAGNQISPETALAAVGEHPATSMAAKQ